MRRGALVLLAQLAGCSFDHGVLSGGRPLDGGDDSALVTIDAPPDAEPTLVAAYNLYGPAYTGIDFPGMWAADPGTICNGTPYQIDVDVTGTVDDVLFTRYQYTYSSMDCAIGMNLPAASYEVTLLFGELYTGPGCYENTIQRIFDVLIEGTVVEDNLNTVAVGGCCNPSATSPGAPFKRVYIQYVADGTVNVTLRAEPQQAAMLSALMVRRL